MISLVAPRTGEDIYVLFSGFLIGPYDQFLNCEGEIVDLPSEFATMTQSRGIWHENNVQHDKVTGDITYRPILYGAYPIPDYFFPNGLMFPMYNYGGIETELRADYGLALPHAVAYSLKNYVFSQVCVEQDPDNPSLWTSYLISGMSYDPHRPTVFRIIDMISIDSIDQIYVRYTTEFTTYNYPLRDYNGPDWLTQQSAETIKGAFAGLTINSSVASQTSTPWYRIRIPDNTVWSPKLAQEHIDGIVRQLVPDKYPIPDVNYGDLAMKASEKISANHVNMIAFLRDLRHPTEMIPKLRNLRRLKSYADDFLTVEYGILPTISDLQTIVAAFKRLGPYVDRNGFRTYSAGALSSKDVDNIHFTLEQHIKLAIGNEDSGFDALMLRLESMGTLPTLENIWDLVPYSFVIDWFIDVGDLLARVDTNLRLMRLDIRYVTQSRKTSITGELAWDVKNPYTGTVKLEQYHRWVSDQCPVPPLSLQSTFQAFNHWLESGALLTQRLKR